MQITLINVKGTLANENIDASDTNTLNQKIMSVFPDNNGWGYDPDNDVLYVTRPNPDMNTSTLGEVVSVDYSMG